MNFKKTIAKSLVVAMALGMVPMANLESAKAEAAKITFDGKAGTATAANAKYWGIAKEDKKGGKDSVEIGGKKYKVTNIKEYAGGIDVYSTLKGKAGIIVAGTTAIPNGEWGALDLPAADNTFKVYVAATTSAVKGVTPAKHKGGQYGYLFASIGKTPKEVDIVGASSEAIQVRLNDGDWQTVKVFFGEDNDAVSKKLQMLGQSGSALTFRVMGTATAWASKEVKVKVPAQPKAPNVKVDITKETTTIKSGMEYQVVDKGGNVVANKWLLSTDRKGLSFADLKLGNDNKDIYVRTAASGKKIASAVTKLTVNKGADALAVKEFKVTGGAIEGVGYVESNLAYNISKGASLYNTSANDVEWALVGGNGNIKWSVLKASKNPTTKPSKAALKYSATAKDNTWGVKDVKLFLRRSGVKQDKNGVATQSGVSAGGIMSLKNIEQNLTFTAASADVTHQGTATKASIKVATGTAAKYTITGKITNVVGKKAAAPKLKKVNDLPKGITLKAGKVDPATGNFEIEINVGKLKEKITAGTAKYTLEFEGVKDGFEIAYAPK